jgi:hypothetical protein
MLPVWSGTNFECSAAKHIEFSAQKYVWLLDSFFRDVGLLHKPKRIIMTETLAIVHILGLETHSVLVSGSAFVFR